MSVGSPLYAATYDATLDPPEPKPACACRRSEIARQIVALAHVEAEASGVDARLRTALHPDGGDYARFLGRVESALDIVYNWGTCDDCAPLMPQDEEGL